MESLHQFRCGERVIAEYREKTLNRCFILVGILVAILVAVASDNGYFAQGIPNDFQHQFHESCTICLCVCCTKSIVVFLLSGLDQFFNGQPEKEFLPLRKQESVPHPAHTTVSIRKGVDEFKLVMEDCAFHQWMKFRMPVPCKEIVHVFSYKCWRRSHVYERSSFEYADASGAESAAFRHQTVHHLCMCFP